ncbi:hypothetical protein BJX65DRAFT_270242 [Aspergillus insuetus]
MLNYGPGHLDARGSSQSVPIPTVYPPIPSTEVTSMASSSQHNEDALKLGSVPPPLPQSRWLRPWLHASCYRV